VTGIVCLFIFIEQVIAAADKYNEEIQNVLALHHLPCEGDVKGVQVITKFSTIVRVSLTHYFCR
jgi:hypothetical protein